MQQVKNFFKEFGTVAILSLIIVLPVRIFIAQPFVVSGQSMDDSFHNGNYLIIDEVSYRFADPKRGDVIVLKAPSEALKLQNLPLDKKVFYIKRIIGLPGETVQIDGDKVKIYNASSTKGFTLNEPYIHIDASIPSPFSNIHEKVTLKTGEYFVMGDNRHNSSDSRIWGPLEKENIKGRTFIRLFPVTQISVFPGEYNLYKN
jgi:signal peptidase I